jgi:hypothetical protein
MTPLRILTVAGWIHPDAEGGSFRFISELNRALVRRGHRPVILTGRVREDLAPEECRDGILVIRYSVKRSGTAAFYHSTFVSVRRDLPQLADQCDFIHLHHPASAFATAFAVGQTIPMVHTLHVAYFLEYLDRLSGRGAGLTGGQ